jgi:hypothetical protein
MSLRNRILQTAFAVLLGTGILAGGIQVGLPAEENPRALPAASRYYPIGEMPEYPGSLEFPLGDGLTINGMPIRISHFFTTDPAEKVRDFFFQELARRGLEPHQSRSGKGGYAVWALDSAAVSQILVAIVPGKRKVDVFPSMVPIDAAPITGSISDEELPASENAVGMMKVEERAAGAGVVTYQEPLLKLEQITERIRQEMGKRGWTLGSGHDGASSGASSTSIELQRGPRRASFTVTAYSSEPVGAAVTVHFSSAPPEGGD